MFPRIQQERQQSYSLFRLTPSQRIQPFKDGMTPLSHEEGLDLLYSHCTGANGQENLFQFISYLVQIMT